MTLAGEKPFDNRAYGGRTQQHRLLATAAVHQPISEDMAALEIGGELNFVDRKECDVDIGRHRLDGADPEARLRGNDFFFAGDERHLVIADAQAHAVIDLASKQSQRQADHARGMRKHALDGEMSLAGIGGTEDGGNATRSRWGHVRATV